jgi:hypothetical protein
MTAAPLPGAHHHINTAAVVSGALFIGLLIGAAGGYYGSKIESSLIDAVSDVQESQAQMEQAQAAQEDASITAESYSEVDTNPLGDVQTNPFQ